MEMHDQHNLTLEQRVEHLEIVTGVRRAPAEWFKQARGIRNATGEGIEVVKMALIKARGNPTWALQLLLARNR